MCLSEEDGESDDVEGIVESLIAKKRQQQFALQVDPRVSSCEARTYEYIKYVPVQSN